MTLSEKIAYLKGVAEGMKLDPESSPEAKLISLMMDILEHMALSVDELDDTLLDLLEERDALDEGDPYPSEFLRNGSSFDEGDEEDPDELDELDEEDFFEVDCPNCGDTLMLDESILLAGEVTCPGCGQLLAVDVSIEAEGEDSGVLPKE